jgi:sec-independent protein translocase protein TatC
MTLGEHLRELRYRVVVSLVAVVVTTTVAYVFHGHILNFVSRPYCHLPRHYFAIQGQCKLVTFGVLEPFTVTLKLALYVGVLAASPVWLFQLWRFITPGLYAHERRYASSFVAVSVLLFAMGASFAYLTLEKGLHFLLGFAGGDIGSLVTFNNYLSFFTAMVLVFAISFEVPLLVVMLNLVGVLPAARLRRWTRGIIFGIFVFAAVATPSQDPFTMTALAVPMCLLYGVAVLVASLHDRRVARRAPLYGDLADDELSSIDDHESVEPA